MADFFAAAGNLIFEWQTLIAGVLALGAALLTVHRMSTQNALQERAIEEANRRFDDQSQRRTWAYRTKIIDVLDMISVYFENCIRELTGQQYEDPLSLPDIAALKESIEYLDPQSAKAVFEIVAKLQVQWARFKSIN